MTLSKQRIWIPTVLEQDVKINDLLKLPAVSILLNWMSGALFIYGIKNTNILLVLPIFYSLYYFRKQKKLLTATIIGAIMFAFSLQRTFTIMNTSLPTSKIEAKLKITDLRIVPDKFSYSQRRFQGEVFYNDKTFKVIAEFSTAPQNLSHGKIYDVEGKFKKPKPPLFKNDFNYGEFLAKKGIIGSFKVSKIKTAQNGRWSLFKATEQIRAKLIERIAYGLNPESETCRYLVGIFLGKKESINRNQKDELLKGGLLHLFAVSGLHVAIVSIFVMLILRIINLNVRIRSFAMPTVMLIYVLITGAPASAMRAWTMIAVWSFARGLFRTVNVYNTISVSALTLLLFNPLYLIDAGFQLSFLIVFFLIRFFNHKRTISEHINVLEKLKTDSNQNIKTVRTVIYDTFYLGAVVFFATLGLQLFYFRIFQPLTIITAVWSGFCAFGLLFTTCLKLIIPLAFFNEIITFFLDPLLLFSQTVSRNNLFIVTKPVSSSLILIYYISLLCISFSKKKRFKINLAVFTTVTFIMINRPIETGWKIHIIKNRENKIAAAVATNQFMRTSTVLLNDRHIQSSVLKLLKSQNIKRIKYLNSQGNIDYLLKMNFIVENETENPSDKTYPNLQLDENQLTINLFNKKHIKSSDVSNAAYDLLKLSE